MELTRPRPEGGSQWTVDRQAVLALVATMMALTVVDVMLGLRLLSPVRPAAAADLIVLGATLVAVAAPAHYRLAAALCAAAGSIAVSRAVASAAVVEYTPVMGFGAWPGIAEFAGIGFLSAWCVRTASTAAATTAAAAFALALAAIVGWRQDGPYGTLLVGLFAALWSLVVLAGVYLRGLDARQHQSALTARQEERIEIARELHDMVAHHVTGIVVQAQAARLVAEARPDAAGRALETIEGAGGEALGAMRRMVGSLRDETAAAELRPAATLDDVRALAAPPARGELPVHVRVDEAADDLPAEVLASVHRIAMESVTNAQRHARGATGIEVDVRCDDDAVIVQVRNDGVSATTPASGEGGFGLTGMAERAEALGGRFHAGPLSTGGWRVAAELPIR